MENHASEWFPEQSWMFELNLSEHGLRPNLKAVNWKRKGGGNSTTFGINELNINSKVGCRGPRLATEEEIKYFNKRMHRSN